MRTRRQSVIAVLLAERGPVPNQDTLLSLLDAKGISATQATLSRDLREMGVVKTPAGYVMPEALSGMHTGAANGASNGTSSKQADPNPSDADDQDTPHHHVIGADLLASTLARVAGSYVVSVRIGVGMVVLKTAPGHAQVVAIELDRAPPTGVIGTVAGDDTIFVATDTADRAETLGSEIRSMVSA